ncbi:MAG: c-type cytochrome [Saprospiraceae bacterium]|nr:c-type cytochrome [Saprospiraceae bacterium]
MQFYRFSVPFHLLCLLILFLFSCSSNQSKTIEIKDNAHIAFIGGNMCSRMMNYGHFETSLHFQLPNKNIYIRNMCDGGDTPGFRPHSGRKTPWAFPGAEKFHSQFSSHSSSEGHFEYPDEWLTRHQADVIFAFFGYSESFAGIQGLELFQAELSAFVDHSLSQQYNGLSAPELVLVSPTAQDSKSCVSNIPSLEINQNLQLYSEAIQKVALEKGVPFIDLYNESKSWFSSNEKLTIDGSQFNNEGYLKLSNFLVSSIFTKPSRPKKTHYTQVKDAVLDKNWYWHNDYKVPNGVHVFGRRYDPFGPDNYPFELMKIRELTSIRDTAIWHIVQETPFDLETADSRTSILPIVETNYHPENDAKYLYGKDAMDQFQTAPGYKIELFASEQEFPDLANPCQMSFDNQGRLWVACMPTYPHYKPGDSKPNDKLLILEDTDKDGKADKQTIFADGLHIPVGFEFAPEGVYISQGTNLKLLTDTDGDDKADKEEIILSGFDDHDTHHVISAFCSDPSGAIYMGEGVFLHSNIETSHGPVRSTNGGFFRYDPTLKRLERTSQVSIPNPWGIAFDEWGQNFFAETSGPDVLWMMPGSMLPMYGVANHKSRNLIEKEHRVRPTSGLEFMHSRHFPDDVQGSILINNTIGFLGTKMHSMKDDGTGYKSAHLEDIVTCTDPNFRPVDMEIAPDGSLYLLDWHNVLIGHMQHNARDPLRDHVHGRVYRVTYPSRPLLTPAQVKDATIAQLLNNLKLPEYRTRYRSRRELRGRKSDEVISGVKNWISSLDSEETKYAHHLLEGLWVQWGINRLDTALIDQLFANDDYRVRSAVIKVIRHSDLSEQYKHKMYKNAVQDNHGRVRMEAFIAATWLNTTFALDILQWVNKLPMDDWMKDAYVSAINNVSKTIVQASEVSESTDLKGANKIAYLQGKEIYSRDAYCGTCHQVDGKGLPISGFPPLAYSKWVTGSEERLIKLVLKGLHGPLELNGVDYTGQVPMTPYEHLLDDEEIAAVLTYIRNSFGNASPMVSASTV